MVRFGDAFGPVFPDKWCTSCLTWIQYKGILGDDGTCVNCVVDYVSLDKKQW